MIIFGSSRAELKESEIETSCSNSSTSCLPDYKYERGQNELVHSKVQFLESRYQFECSTHGIEEIQFREDPTVSFSLWFNLSSISLL